MVLNILLASGKTKMGIWSQEIMDILKQMCCEKIYSASTSIEK